jgi:PD-(D/E)XK nuclease superfamily
MPTANRISINEMYKLAKLSEKLHWLKIGSDGIPELYLDNHMMQTFRMCESRFFLDFVEGYSAKNAHLWFLDFGICTHTMIEYYYIHRKDEDFNILNWAGTLASELWTKMNMDEYYGPGSPWHHKNYSSLGGLTGFCSLLLQYAQVFHQENERFRVIGTELYFGKEKEVPLVNWIKIDQEPEYMFRLYLSGKIDLLMDDGFNIGPMDHKTSSNFMGKNPIVSYEVHEGMIGYVYAAKQLLKIGLPSTWDPQFDSVQKMGRNTNKIWINFLQVEPLPEKRRDGSKPTINERFKRMPLFYTDYQLEQYRLRQISTSSRIMQLLLNDSLQPTRNTMACTNYMHHVCSYHEVHRQNSRESELTQLNSSFVQKGIWDPENRDNDNLLGE